MTLHEGYAWAAGFFDGEGHVRFCNLDKRGYSRLWISIAQNDRQVLDKFITAVGHGTISGPYERVGSSPSFALSVSGFLAIQDVLCKLWPWLSPIKRAQFYRSMRLGIIYHSEFKKYPKNSHITFEQAKEIKNSTESNESLSIKFGIRPASIERIKRGERWKNA